MCRPLSAGLLPGGTATVDLLLPLLAAETKDGKQSRTASAVPFEVDMLAEDKQPTASKQQT